MLNRLGLWIARNRPLRDRTGPAFYLNHGGPQAFYHYEETEKLEIVRALPLDGVFLDVGANIGLFSVYVSKLLPLTRSYAFEPNPILAECIRKTARLSSFSQLQVEETCLSDRDGVMDLYLHTENSGGASLLKNNIEKHQRGQTVQVDCITLDHWIVQQRLARVDVIKIDVQGAEPSVLTGARECIARDMPMILAEVADIDLLQPDSAWPAVLEFLSQLGYRARAAGTLHAVPAKGIQAIAQVSASKNKLPSYANYVFEIAR